VPDRLQYQCTRRRQWQTFVRIIPVGRLQGVDHFAGGTQRKAV
jgi:hypothetical protein